MSEEKTTVSPMELAELARRAAFEPKFVTVEDANGKPRQIALMPTVDEEGRSSVKLESVKKYLDEYRSPIERRKGTATMGDLASLIEHTNRFKDADSVVFANTDRAQPSITAVLDYHRAGHDSEARHGEHRSKYAFPLSTEWREWTGLNKKEMTQAAFAEFIESHIVETIDPAQALPSAAMFANMSGLTFATPSKLMELSRGLSITVEAKVANIVNLKSGEKQIRFSETHVGENGEELKIPSAFLIAIPVFRGEDRYQMVVCLRYRKREGALVWIMELHRYEETLDAAIKESCDLVKKETGLPLLVGTPE
jgi:uncharacterized protein YfdQ (DUF2303 family)